VDASTIDPSTAKAVAQTAATHSAIFADAPVSGGILAACCFSVTYNETTSSMGIVLYSYEELVILCIPLTTAGVGGAEKGTLTFMVGCEEERFEGIRELLSAMGKNIVRCGPHGTGQVRQMHIYFHSCFLSYYNISFNFIFCIIVIIVINMQIFFLVGYLVLCQHVVMV
jgi:3-hydroxyisobutyrate dehydrogenase